jgi:hypothetical protein
LPRQYYLWPQADNDYFSQSITLPLNQQKTIKIWVRSIPVGTNYNVALYDPANVLVVSSNAGGNANEYIEHIALVGGVYKIRVFSVSGASSTDTYEIETAQSTSPLGGYP